MGSSTKLIGLVMHSRKEYVALMELHREVDPDRVVEVLKQFVGKIYQRPPLRSSVKRVLRIREIYYIEPIEFRGRYVLFRVGCQSGTYIRKLCHDVGLVLGVEAHMRELRRTATGHFREENGIYTLHEVSEALYLWRRYGYEDLLRRVVQPAELIVANLPKIVIRDSAVDAIAHGAQLAVPGILKLHQGIKKGERVAVFTLKGELVAIGRAEMSSDEIVGSERGIAVRIERVFMEPGVYPAMWKRRRGEKSEQRG